MNIFSSIVLALAFTTSPMDSIVQIASSSDDLETLVAAVSAADLVELLDGDQELTVLAPTDSAFAEIDKEVLAGLLQEPGTPTLRRILAHHVIEGSLDSSDIADRDSITTLAGTVLPVTATNDRIIIGDAVVSTADIKADNGMIHLIDRVLIPPAEESPLRRLLAGAVQKGVLFFNDGNPGACAAIYATAVEAVILGSGWGLTTEQSSALARARAEAAAISDPTDRAWAYRRIIDVLLSMQSDGASPVPSDERMIIDFSDSDERRRWQIVLDGVMGGLSTGNVVVQDGIMRFTGETSLDNNGGFSSIRRALPRGAFSGTDAIRMRVRGDGRTWIVGTRKARNMGGDSYWTRFDTIDGEWITVEVPIRGMERHYFGNRRPGSIDPDEVMAFEFYIYDKKAGPFSLEVDSIGGIVVNEEFEL